MRRSRFLTAPVTLLLLLASFLAPQASCAEPNPREPATVLGVKHFDANRLHLYWEGVLIASPAILTWDGETLRMNGVGPPEPEPFDTAKVSARLAPIFAGTPFIDSLVATGTSYLEATNRYACEMLSRLGRIVLQLKQRAKVGPAARRPISVGDLALQLGVKQEAVKLGPSQIECTIAGGGRISLPLDAPDSILTRSPCGPRPPSAPPSDAEKLVSARSHAKFILRTLEVSERRLMISRRGHWYVSNFSGADAQTVLNEIASACRIYDRAGAEGIRRECGGYLLGRDDLILLARRRTER